VEDVAYAAVAVAVADDETDYSHAACVVDSLLLYRSSPAVADNHLSHHDDEDDVVVVVMTSCEVAVDDLQYRHCHQTHSVSGNVFADDIHPAAIVGQAAGGGCCNYDEEVAAVVVETSCSSYVVASTAEEEVRLPCAAAATSCSSCQWGAKAAHHQIVVPQ